MLGNTPIAAVLGAAPLPTAPAVQLKSFAKAATSVGLALLLVAPGEKIPVDMRSPAQRRKDDDAAREAARELGRSDWSQAKSLAGSHLATTDATLIGRYIDKYRKVYGDDVAVNFAIETGRSNLIVVDCDTTEQKLSFLSDFGVPADVAPTVVTPGKINADGTHAHYDGGHYYFTIPEGVELTPYGGSITDPEGKYAILWKDRYILIPPSVRAEGSYTLVGQDYTATQQLVDRVNTYGESRKPRSRDEMSELELELGSAVDTWAELITWADILAPHGWLESGRSDNCGCDVWTAPGDHGSPKSATTHDGGCTLGRYTTVNAPMHIWTDNPGGEFEQWFAEGGSKTVTKLQAIAVLEHGGDVGEAMNKHDLIPSGGMSIDIELGVSVNNMDDATESKASNMDDEITLPVDPIVPGARDDETIRAELQAKCSHQSVSKIGRCFTCGVEVAPPTMNALPEPVPDKVTESSEGHSVRICDTCDAAFPDPEFYVSPDGDVWHAQDNGEDHEADLAEDDPTPAEAQAQATVDSFIENHTTATLVEVVWCGVCDEYVPDSETFAPPGRALHHRRNGYHETGPDPTEVAVNGIADVPAPEPAGDPGTVDVHSVREEPEVSEPAGTGEPTAPVESLFDCAGAPPAPVHVGGMDGQDVPVDTVIENYDVLRSSIKGVPIIAPFDHWRGISPPEYIVDGLIEHRALSCIIGAPGTGKSLVAIDIACSIVTGQRWQGRKVIPQRVLYLPGEGMSGAVQRIKAWELAHNLNVGQDLLVGDSIIQLAAEKEAWAEVAQFIVRHRVGLIIFDTFARMSLGIDENSATEVGKAVRRFDQIRELTNAGVLVVHHTGKNGESARGSSALNGALDSEIKIVAGGWTPDDGVEGTPITLHTTKQKNAEMLGGDGMPLLLAPMHESAVVTGETGKVGDPIDTMAGMRMLTPEPLVETSIRIRKFIDKFPKQGATRSEIMLGVEMDEYLVKRKNSDLAWKLRVSEAVDAALRYELIETLTGTASGSRYIPGPYGSEAARKKASEEIIID